MAKVEENARVVHIGFSTIHKEEKWRCASRTASGVWHTWYINVTSRRDNVLCYYFLFCYTNIIVIVQSTLVFNLFFCPIKLDAQQTSMQTRNHQLPIRVFRRESVRHIVINRVWLLPHELLICLCTPSACSHVRCTLEECRPFMVEWLEEKW